MKRKKDRQSKYECRSFALEVMGVEVKFHSCCDRDTHCQDVLVALHGKLHPDTHVFGDLTHRIPGDMWTRLEAVRQSCLEEAQQGAGCDAAEIGVAFVQKGLALLRESVSEVPATGYCVRHKAMCPYKPVVARGDIWMELGGNTCTPWSMSGKKLGFLDFHSSVALVWGFALAGLPKMQTPDVIINENVPRWPADAFWTEVCSAYARVSLQLSPTAFGHPVNRVRKYVALAKKGFNFDPTTCLHWDILQFCSEPIDASIYFCAPSRVKDKHLHAAAAARSLEVVEGMTAKDLLTFSVRQRLQEYKRLFAQVVEPGAVALVDLSQNADYAKPGDFSSRVWLPTLKGSKLSSLILLKPAT